MFLTIRVAYKYFLFFFFRARILFFGLPMFHDGFICSIVDRYYIGKKCEIVLRIRYDVSKSHHNSARDKFREDIGKIKCCSNI